jgi:putative ABC transport system permease protein
MAPLIKVEGLRHRWGEGFELFIDSWRMERGERVALVGQSGSGKTTLLMILAGVLPVQEGEVWVLGAPLHTMTEAERRMWRARSLGVIAQDFPTLAHLNALENAMLPDRLGLAPNPCTRSQAESIMGNLGLSECLHRSPKALSQGERQRVAVSRAILCGAPLLLADEPTAHLDPPRAQEVIDRFHTLVNEGERLGVVVVTHHHEMTREMTHVYDVDRWSSQSGPSPQRPSPPSDMLNKQSTVVSPREESLARHNELEEGASLALSTKRSALIALAVRALGHYWGRSLILTLTFALTASLPIGVSLLSDRYEHLLRERAVETPMVVGAAGSRYDLTLSSLYFSGALLRDTSWGAYLDLISERLAIPVPLHLKWSASGFPVVGTTPEYYERRGLSLARGHLPFMVGEVVIGAEVASRLGVEVGDSLLTDQEDLYNLAATYPMSLTIVGILKPRERPDDSACFVDIKTAWVIEGIGHGHQKLAGAEGEIVEASAAVVTAQAVTDQNQEQYHFHGDMSEFPLSAVLLYPPDAKSSSLLKARSMRRESWLVLTPSAVVDELLSLIFKVEAIFEVLGQILLGLTTALGALVIWLSAQLRSQERHTLALLGLSRVQVFKLATFEACGLLIGAGVLCVITLFLFSLGLESSLSWLPLSRSF